MSKLLGQMDNQLVGVYRQALMADVPSSVPIAEGLRGISDIKNVLSVINETRRTIGATGAASGKEAASDPDKDSPKAGVEKLGGDDIRAIQQRLVDYYGEGVALPEHGVDGIMGPETRQWIDIYNSHLDDAQAMYDHIGILPGGVGMEFEDYFQEHGSRDVSSSFDYNENLRNSPLQRIDMQQQAPMVDVGTALSQVKASNKVVAERVKATNGSLTNKHFGSIKRWHKATLQIIETENEAGTLQQAIGIQNSLSALNERAKRLRADYADIVLNDEISNYAYSYFNFFISEYLSSETGRMLAKNPNSGEYEYVFGSKREGRPILMEEVEKNMRALTKDVGTQASILQQINTLTKVAKNITKKQPGPQEFKSIALDIVKKGRITSMIYDDMLNNGSSFFEDIKEHPAFLKPDVASLPELAKEPGEFNWYDNISANDLTAIYDIITNPENPMFNYKTSSRDPLGITETLLVEYIGGYFEDHYNKAKGTVDKKPTEVVDQKSPIQKKQPMSKEDILKKYNI